MTLSKNLKETMTRPKKAGDDKRELMVYVRMNASEKSKLLSNAAHAGLTPSDFIRSRTIGSQPSTVKATPNREPLIRALAELGKIGSNVNQIARALNRRTDSSDFPIALIEQALGEVKLLTMSLNIELGYNGNNGSR